MMRIAVLALCVAGCNPPPEDAASMAVTRWGVSYPAGTRFSGLCGGFRLKINVARGDPVKSRDLEAFGCQGPPIPGELVPDFLAKCVPVRCVSA